MNQQEAKRILNDFFRKSQNYEHMMATLHFDTATIAPKKGLIYRDAPLQMLNAQYIQMKYDPMFIKSLDEIHETVVLDEPMKTAFDKLYKEINETRYTPQEVLVELSQRVTEGNRIWEEAKEKSSYALFEPALKEVIRVEKEAYRYDPRAISIFDKALDEYESGMNEAVYDQFFSELKEHLVPFIHEIKKIDQMDDSILHQSVSIEKQKKFTEVLESFFLMDKDRCYLGESTHPFTIGISPDDVRITTHYYEHNVMSSIFSFIHEYGHAQFELQVSDELLGLNTHSIDALALHESQSRFLENHIGRNEAFWDALYPKFQEIFQEEFGSLRKEDFVRLIHKSEPSLIRIEADELTYPLHVLIRYELEKEMMNQEVDTTSFATLWADKYESYLGVRPTTDAEGILQDMHWANGQIGYFPTYAFGSAMAAQFYHAMSKDINVEEALRNGKYEKIQEWLKVHIHQYGSSKTSEEILLLATGEPLNPKYYIDYLIKTYRHYYHL